MEGYPITPMERMPTQRATIVMPQEAAMWAATCTPIQTRTGMAWETMNT